VKDLLLLDVTPLSLGIETLGGVMTRLIDRNTTIPTKKMEVFSTASDSQTSVEVHVLQGEREMAGSNRTLGKFHLVGIPPAPRGVPQIEVTFDIDANGILNVSAKDRATGKNQAITITSSSGLEQDEIERMVKDAEAHADDDKKRKQEVELKNQADNLAYNLEKLLSENKEKLPAADVETTEKAIAAARKAVEEGDAEAIQKAVDELNAASHKLAEVLYKNASTEGPGAGGQAPPPGGQDAGGGSGDTHADVVDAEVVNG
jgi:molecular chaperone DnaK